MDVGGFHRFARRQLWRLAGLTGVLFAAALILGAHTVVLALEWAPMTISLLLVGAHARKAVARVRRR